MSFGIPSIWSEMCKEFLEKNKLSLEDLFRKIEASPMARRMIRIETIFKQAGLKNRRFHLLRRTHSSNLISENVNTKYLSERLGQTSVIVTIDIYGHCFTYDSRQQIENVLIALEKNGS